MAHCALHVHMCSVPMSLPSPCTAHILHASSRAPAAREEKHTLLSSSLQPQPFTHPAHLSKTACHARSPTDKHRLSVKAAGLQEGYGRGRRCHARRNHQGVWTWGWRFTMLTLYLELKAPMWWVGAASCLRQSRQASIQGARVAVCCLFGTRGCCR